MSMCTKDQHAKTLASQGLRSGGMQIFILPTPFVRFSDVPISEHTPGMYPRKWGICRNLGFAKTVTSKVAL